MEVWSNEEALEAVRLMDVHGRAWQKIGAEMGRTASSVRNKMQRIQRGPDPNKKQQFCRHCGKPRRGHVCLMARSTPSPTDSHDSNESFVLSGQRSTSPMRDTKRQSSYSTQMTMNFFTPPYPHPFVLHNSHIMHTIPFIDLPPTFQLSKPFGYPSLGTPHNRLHVDDLDILLIHLFGDLLEA